MRTLSFSLTPGVHHWDEYGPHDEDVMRHPNFPPQNIVDTQKEEVGFVKQWLKEFEDSRKGSDQTKEDDFPGEL